MRSENEGVGNYEQHILQIFFLIKTLIFQKSEAFYFTSATKHSSQKEGEDDEPIWVEGEDELMA